MKVASISRNSKEGYTYTSPPGGRSCSGLIAFTGCEAIYTQHGRKTMHARRGDFVYLPKGGIYTAEYQNCDHATGTGPGSRNEFLVNFEMVDDKGQAFALSETVFAISLKTDIYNEYYNRMLALPGAGFEQTGHIKAFLYGIMTEFSLGLHRENIISSRFSGIYKGIMYMERHYASNVRISKLAEICHVSESCFRRLFRQYSGMSPTEYISRLKEAKAKLMLKSNLFTIAEVAASLGFDDPFYFSRFYKRMTGKSPKEERKQELQRK